MKIIPLKITLVLLTLALAFIACQKDDMPDSVVQPPPPNPTINSNLGGTFYAHRTSAGSFSPPFAILGYTIRDTADVNVKAVLDGDTLRVLGFNLAIDSANQTVFTYANRLGMPGGLGIEVRYINNYDSIYIQHHTPFGQYSGHTVVHYKGTRGSQVELPNSGTFYNLRVNHQETRFDASGVPTMLIDTQYTTDVLVEYSRGATSSAPDLAQVRFDLDSVSFFVKGFESFYKQEQKALNTSREELLNQHVYWKNDSFYLREQALNYRNGTSMPADTNYYLYQGRVQ
ncbi:MAG: hypothetical protein AB8E82_01990 [Aureispira sp.]